jgi:hypothetical protein
LSKQSEYEARQRAKYKALGLVPRRVYIRAEDTEKLKRYVERLNKGHTRQV